jgi:hypothetical protein
MTDLALLSFRVQTLSALTARPSSSKLIYLSLLLYKKINSTPSIVSIVIELPVYNMEVSIIWNAAYLTRTVSIVYLSMSIKNNYFTMTSTHVQNSERIAVNDRNILYNHIQNYTILRPSCVWRGIYDFARGLHAIEAAIDNVDSNDGSIIPCTI